jgi:dihydropteroate synthase
VIEIFTFGGVTHVMGVINMSPESNNVHTVARSVDEALAMADSYRSAGASVIDVGGQSSHYANPTIETSLEIDRLAPVVERLVDDGHIVSIDTWKPTVVEAMLPLGVQIVNDTGGLGDPQMLQLVAESGVMAVVMYIEGANPHTVEAVELIADKAALTTERLAQRLTELEPLGITSVLVDPGISINYKGDYAGYTRMQLDVIRNLSDLHSLGKPILIPIPRKQEDHRVSAYITMALEFGADMIRVHDVEMACDLARLFDRLPEG